MRKLLFIGLGITMCLSDASASNGKPRKFKSYPRVKFEQKAIAQMRYAEIEAKANSANLPLPTDVVYPEKKSVAPTTPGVTSVTYSTLGKSVNPYTSITNGRNYVSVLPTLNTVAIFRRGSIDEKPIAEEPQNEIYYDLSTKGGAEGTWQVARGNVFDNEVYTTVGSDPNFAPRYPQGVLVNPVGNTDTNNVLALSVNRVLDGTNDAWGGLGKGWQSLENGSSTKQMLWSSQVDPLPVFNFAQYGLDQTSTGAIFTVSPELDLSAAAGFEFTDKVMVFKYVYNSTTESFDSTVTFLPFVNDGQDPPTSVGDVQVSFGPDGQTGYVVVNGYNPTLAAEVSPSAPIDGNSIFISKTTNGGDSWSDLKIFNINKTAEELDYKSPGKDDFRRNMLGNYLMWSNDSTVTSSDSGAQFNAHAVKYSVLDMDLTVDKHNYPHIFCAIGIVGVGDTVAYESGSFYPGYGSWFADLTLKPGTDSLRGEVVGFSQSLVGCWGACPTADESFNEFNRPHTTRSADGSTIALVWYSTDLELNPPTQTGNTNNSKPDMIMRALRVEGPGEFYYQDTSVSITEGSQYAGNATLGSVAPTMLNTPTGYAVASTIALLSTYNATATAARWPITHLYLNGVEVSNQLSAFPKTRGRQPWIILGNEDQITNKQDSKIEIGVYPNPTKGALTARFQVAKAGKANVKVMNTIGQTVESFSVNVDKGVSNIPMNVKNLKAGIYFLTIESAGKLSSQKFIKD